MSARNFYQTLYHNDALFQLPGETWDVATSADTSTVVDTPALILDSTDLLMELDNLSAGSLTNTEQPLAIDLVVDEQIVSIEIPLPDPVVLAAKPEPLPQPQYGQQYPRCCLQFSNKPGCPN